MSSFSRTSSQVCPSPRAVCRLFDFSAVVIVAPALPADAKKDPDLIGYRDVDKGINFYSIEKEIALWQTDGTGS